MDIQGATGAHGQLLQVAKGINRAALVAHLPASLIADVFIQDPGQKQQVMAILQAIEAMSGAPLLQHKHQQGLQTLQNAPDKLQAAHAVGRDVGGEHLLQALPTIENILKKILTR